MSLAVTCHLHFWRNDRDLLRDTAVTRGWNGYRDKSQHRKISLEKKILSPLLPGPFDHESDALTTELSPLSSIARRKEAWKEKVVHAVSDCVKPVLNWANVCSRT